jgi:2-C-methyl-D-erythritol 2,4-cyclodiphosphate synthase
LTAAHRVGTGFDVHRLVDGRALVLGGVTIASDRGLAGHSDGDCVIHAVCDAVLGALAAGDMGRHFPSADKVWKDADSSVFLATVADMAVRAGYAVTNLDVTVVAQAPRLEPHVEGMRANLALALRVGAAAVSVKVKSTDGLGAIGRGEGIAAHAVVLLERTGRGE